MFTITAVALQQVAGATQQVAGATQQVAGAAQPDFATMDGATVLEWAERVRAAGLIRVAHGDAGHWLRRGYQNESLLFWHRELGFLFPSRIASNAGEVPPCFRVGNGPDDFAPDHWAEAVDGAAVFVSDAIVEELRAALQANLQAAQPADLPAAPFRPSIKIRGRVHPVVGLKPEHLAEQFLWFDACTGECTCGELRRW
jgi:hypothetical protein